MDGPEEVEASTNGVVNELKSESMDEEDESRTRRRMSSQLRADRCRSIHSVDE